MKILILNWRDPFDPKSGGAEQVTLKHARYWVDNGHSVSWLSGSFENSKAHEKKYGIDFFRIGSSQTLFLRASFIYWLKFKGNFDIVVDEIHGIPSFSPLWAFKSKKVAFIHELAGEIWNEMFTPIIAFAGRFIETTIFPLVYKNTHFWVDSISTKKDLESIGIVTKKISVIPCATDVCPIRSKYKSNNLSLIFISRLVPMKGLHIALKVFEEIIKNIPTASLIVVGAGNNDYEKENKIRAKKISKNIHFLGKVSEIKKCELLAESHFLLHTSIKEGFGLTVLEANSQKTPSAVFDVSALRDIVEDGKTGVVADFGDSELLAKKIISVYKDKSRYMKMCNEVHVFSKQFIWSKFTKKSLQLLKEL